MTETKVQRIRAFYFTCSFDRTATVAQQYEVKVKNSTLHKNRRAFRFMCDFPPPRPTSLACPRETQPHPSNRHGKQQDRPQVTEDERHTRSYGVTCDLGDHVSCSPFTTTRS